MLPSRSRAPETCTARQYKNSVRLAMLTSSYFGYAGFAGSKTRLHAAGLIVLAWRHYREVAAPLRRFETCRCLQTACPRHMMHAGSGTGRPSLPGGIVKWSITPPILNTEVSLPLPHGDSPSMCSRSVSGQLISPSGSANKAAQSSTDRLRTVIARASETRRLNWVSKEKTKSTSSDQACQTQNRIQHYLLFDGEPSPEESWAFSDAEYTGSRALKEAKAMGFHRYAQQTRSTADLAALLHATATHKSPLQANSRWVSKARNKGRCKKEARTSEWHDNLKHLAPCYEAFFRAIHA